MSHEHLLDAHFAPLRGLPLAEQISVIQEQRPKNPDYHYAVYGDTIGQYQVDFDAVMDGVTIADFLTSREAPLVIDLMAPSNTIRDLFFSNDYIAGRRGIAVTLEDRRSYRHRSWDKQLNIKQLTTDLTTNAGYRDLIRQMDRDKADLIMERALLGLAHLPTHPEYYRIALERVWQLLDSNGGMFLGQTLSQRTMENHGIPIIDWVNSMNQDGIDARFEDTAKSITYGALKIVKHEDSPRRLNLPIFYNA